MESPFAEGFYSDVTIEVAWGDMDAWQHVNNTMYFRYIETARFRYLTDIGWRFHGDDSLLAVLSRVEAKFLSPVLFPSTLRAVTRPTELRTASFTLEHQLFRVSGGPPLLVTIGTSVVVPLDPRSQRAMRVPDDLRARIEGHLPPRP